MLLDWLPSPLSQRRWAPRRRHSHSDYKLPNALGWKPRARRMSWLINSYVKLALSILVGLGFLWHVRRLQRDSRHAGRLMEGIMEVLIPEHGQRAPLYERFRKREIEKSAMAGDPPNAKYLFFANHVNGAGWGNIMQELLLHAYTAHRLNRTFVWYDSTWNNDGSKYTFYNGKRIPSRIPLSAILRGPIVGDPMTTETPTGQPVAIAADYFHKICPPGVRRKVTAKEIKAQIPHQSTAATLLYSMMKLIGAMPDKCIEVSRPLGVYDYLVFGEEQRLLDVWPEYSQSFTLQEFFWSPLVELAFDTNRELFSPTSLSTPFLNSTPLRPLEARISPSAARYSTLPGLLVLHVRRGDFAEHCVNLARWRSTYVGFNSFPELPDKFSYAPDTPENERVRLYRPHCYVEVEDIVRRVAQVRGDERSAGRGELRDVYLMTNGPEEWVAQLKKALDEMGGWNLVASSRDLVVDWEQQYVKHAVDMLIGQRAQVFVGNGFSSLSGAITMLRMANGLPPSQTRFL